MEWIFSSIDSSRPHEIDFTLSWHARLMVLSWSVLLPAGVIWARFMKVTPHQKWPEELDNKTWWRGHLRLQYSGVIIACVATTLIWFRAPLDHQAGYHEYMGWSLVALGLCQIMGGWLRGSKGGPTDARVRGHHFDMTPRRVAFEYAHKILGYSALLLAIATTFSGLWQANAPYFMWILLVLWWSTLLVVFILLEYRGKAIDTYQAIWGPAQNLPGNKKKLIYLPFLKPLRFAEPNPPRQRIGFFNLAVGSKDERQVD